MRRAPFESPLPRRLCASWVALALAGLAALAALSSVLWVHAFSTGTSRSGGSVAVVSSDAALLAVAPCANACAANQTGIAALSGGQVVLDFRKGAAGSNYGVQTGATYTFKELVWVTNNAGRAVSVSAALAGAGSDLVYVRDQNGNTLVGSGAGVVSLAAGGQLKLDFRWQGSSGAGTARSVQLTVSAT